MFPAAPVPAAPTVPRMCLAWQPGPGGGPGQGYPGHVGRKEEGSVGGRGGDEEGRDVSPGHRAAVTASGIQSQARKCHPAGRAAPGPKGLEWWPWRVTGLKALRRALSPFPASFSTGFGLAGEPPVPQGDTPQQARGCQHPANWPPGMARGAAQLSRQRDARSISSLPPGGD